MATDPRAALDRFIAALEAHYDAARGSSDPDSPAVDAAANAVEDAFFTYDDALYTRFHVAVPLEAYGEDDDDEDDDDLEELEIEELDELNDADH
ncbi:DNA primase [Georgenia faecalis]|uniref:DNA primase n=1 Tax=Georgenia faecalis TaxID=2483799 RepID=A0ABV9DBR9_9MICO|nr:DNA primase [Georgenia faecalis]